MPPRAHPRLRRPSGSRSDDAPQATAVSCRERLCGSDAESPDQTTCGDGGALPGPSGRALLQPFASRRSRQLGDRRPRCRGSRPPLGRRNRVRGHEHLWALAWRAALRASGSPLPLVDASARYAVGCGVNAIAPAHVGSALRVALFGRVTNGGCWTVSGAAAAVGVTRIVWLGVLIAIGSAGGVLPLGRSSYRRHRRSARVRSDRLASRLAAGPDRATAGGLPLARRVPRAISRSSPAGRSPAPPRRSQQQPRSSPRSGSTTRCAPRSSSSPPSNSPLSSRSLRGTSGSRVQRLHSRSALRGSIRGPRCRRESRSERSSF